MHSDSEFCKMQNRTRNLGTGGHIRFVPRIFWKRSVQPCTNHDKCGGPRGCIDFPTSNPKWARLPPFPSYVSCFRQYKNVKLEKYKNALHFVILSHVKLLMSSNSNFISPQYIISYKGKPLDSYTFVFRSFERQTVR